MRVSVSVIALDNCREVRRFFFCASRRNFNNDDATGNRSLWVCSLAGHASVNREDLKTPLIVKSAESCKLFQGRREGWRCIGLIYSRAEGESLGSGCRGDVINEMNPSKLRSVRTSNPQQCHLSPLTTREHDKSRLFQVGLNLQPFLWDLHLIINWICDTCWTSLYIFPLKIVKCWSGNVVWWKINLLLNTDYDLLFLGHISDNHPSVFWTGP